MIKVTLRVGSSRNESQADKFADNRFCDDWDLILLIFNNTYITKLLTLVASGIAVVEIKRFLFVTWSQTFTYLKDYVTPRFKAPHNKSQPSGFLWSKALC